jgi:hypothetical protein
VMTARFRYLVHGNTWAVNPEQAETKECAHYHLGIEGGQEAGLKLSLSAASEKVDSDVFGDSFDVVFAQRIQEANAFIDLESPYTHETHEAQHEQLPRFYFD